MLRVWGLGVLGFGALSLRVLWFRVSTDVEYGRKY